MSDSLLCQYWGRFEAVYGSKLTFHEKWLICFFWCTHSDKLLLTCMPRYADLLQQDFEEASVPCNFNPRMCFVATLGQSQLSRCLMFVSVRDCLLSDLNQ